MSERSPADMLAAIVRGEGESVDAQPAPEPRAPAPNMAQGSSGLSRYVDPAAAHAQAVEAFGDVVREYASQPASGMWFDPLTGSFSHQPGDHLSTNIRKANP